MDALRDFLAHSEMLRLFAVIALGYLLGEVRLPGNFRFGIAAVLFVGLALSAWDTAAGGEAGRFRVAESVSQIGLGLFVYCVGLDVAPGFFRTIRDRGLFVISAAFTSVLVAAVIIFVFGKLGARDPALMAGAFAGALTNTPSLATVTDALRSAGASAETQSLAVVGYGTVYPFAVIGLLLMFQFFLVGRSGGSANGKSFPSRWIPPASIAVEKRSPSGEPWRVDEVLERLGVVITRVRHADGEITLARPDDALEPGLAVVAVGSERDLEAAVAALGARCAEPLESPGFEVHRYSLSNPQIAGRPLAELGLEKIGAVVSRVRRGDVELPVRPDLVLLLGDRLRVVSTRDTEEKVRRLIGNSMHMLSETGYLTFAIGIVLGLIIGAIPIPIPGMPAPLRLGSAGGPLLVSLVLGALARTGPFVWALPAGANHTLRQFGLLLFLAAVGLKAGGDLLPALRTDGLFLVMAGGTAMVAYQLVLWAFLRAAGEKDPAVYAGQSSGLQTQPAALAFANQRFSPATVTTAYATIFPFAMVCKVVLAQVLLLI